MFLFRTRQKDKSQWNISQDDKNAQQKPAVPVNKELAQVISRLAQFCASFKECLSPEEKVLYQDVDGYATLLRDLEARCQAEKGDKKYSKIHACFDHINTFASRLRPFVEAIDMVVSSHPEIAAIVWGALKLLFIVGLGFLVTRNQV
ncbi:hypothetical protein F4777DRAFT_117552 [Nemania sp. FL0916]|nr:hypothetical protein F4777DRAFT_117552 [Nemania sp. FL0916]